MLKPAGTFVFDLNWMRSSTLFPKSKASAIGWEFSFWIRERILETNGILFTNIKGGDKGMFFILFHFI